MFSNLINKIKPDLILWLGIFLIVVGHVFFEFTAPHSFEYLYNFYHIKPQTSSDEGVITTIFYSHHQPPLFFSIFLLYNAFISYSLFPFKILLLAMHILSWKWIYQAFKKLNFNKVSQIFTLIVIINPSNIYMIRQIGYTPFLFFISSLMLKIFTSSKSVEHKFWSYCLVLIIISLTRATYQFYVLILLLIPWYWFIEKKLFFKGVTLTLLPVLSWSFKNFLMFGFLGTSSWYGFNLSGHINSLDCGCLNQVKKSNKLVAYEHCFAEPDPLKIKYQHIPSLNQGNMQDVGYVRISKAFIDEIKQCFSPKVTLLTTMYGFFSFFSSSVIDGFYDIQKHWFQYKNLPVFDIFDLPNIEILKNEMGVGSWIRFSWFTFIYPFSLSIIIIKYKKLESFFLILLVYLIIISLLYITIDPNESSRMRFELEPIYLLFTGFVLNLKSINPNR